MPNMTKFDQAISECRLRKHFHYRQTDRQKDGWRQGRMERGECIIHLSALQTKATNNMQDRELSQGIYCDRDGVMKK